MTEFDLDVTWSPDSLLLSELSSQVPHLEQYFGLWAIQHAPFQSLVDRVGRMDLRVHVLQQEGQEILEAANQREYEVTTAGVAVINATGPLMKYASSLSDNTSTIRLRRQLRLATRDEEVSGILLRIDSPGGTSAGLFDLVDDVRAASQQKTVLAYIEDTGASAAYALASAAEKVYANSSAIVGSIGTYSVIRDMQGTAAQLGMKVFVVRAGKYKGMGEPGTEITAEHLAEIQRVVDGMNEFFLRSVQRGRGLTRQKLEELADGRVWIGSEAKDLGLIDGVESLDATLQRFTRKRSSQMTQQAEAPVRPVASVEEIRGACPGAPAEFLLAQLESRATVQSAMTAWIGEQQRQLLKARQETEQAQAEAKKPGVAALGGKQSARQDTQADFEGDPRAEFDREVRERMKVGAKRADAVAAVARSRPELHEAFLLATNPGCKKQQLIRDRFASED